jgi:hypothetical protein
MRRENREAINERQRQYRAANPEKYKASNKRSNDRHYKKQKEQRGFNA